MVIVRILKWGVCWAQAAVFVAACLLSACGGGGRSESRDSDSGGTGPPPPAPLTDEQLAARAASYSRAPDPLISDLVVDRDVLIPMADGSSALADVYRPNTPGQYPVLMSWAPYPKGTPWADGGSANGVEDTSASTRYLEFETPNPDFWVPRGYVFIRVAAPGFQGAPGSPEILNDAEAQRYYDAIEWAAAQSYSDSKVCLVGISYYAVSQYRVAGLKPPHLRCILPWEGAVDPYRDVVYQGGILSQFGVIFGLGMESYKTTPASGEAYPLLILLHPLLDEAWRERIADLSKIDVPMMAVGTLVDIDLHLRGSTEAFMASPNPYKRLQLLWGTHWGTAYKALALSEQMRFLDYWLKDIDTGIYDEPPVKIQIRTGAQSFVTRYGDNYPLPETRWTKLYLRAGASALDNAGTLSTTAPAAGGLTLSVSVPEPEAVCTTLGLSFQCVKSGSTFTTEPMTEDTDIAGPVMAKLWVSTLLTDADFILELHDLDENGHETRFGYYYEDQRDNPVARGWLRLSHRKLDAARSTFWRPVHTHDEVQLVAPGEAVPIEVEFWPTAMRFKKGHRLQLSIRHNNWLRQGAKGFDLSVFVDALPQWPLPDQFDVSAYQSYSPLAGATTIYSGGTKASYVQLPVVPPKTGS